MPVWTELVQTTLLTPAGMTAGEGGAIDRLPLRATRRLEPQALGFLGGRRSFFHQLFHLWIFQGGGHEVADVDGYLACHGRFDDTTKLALVDDLIESLGGLGRSLRVVLARVGELFLPVGKDDHTDEAIPSLGSSCLGLAASRKAWWYSCSFLGTRDDSAIALPSSARSSAS